MEIWRPRYLSLGQWKKCAFTDVMDRQKSQLLGSAVVEQYLGSAVAEDVRVSEDDFS